MLKCPKCKEPIGDNLETCPICFHKITDHERVLMMKARDKEMDKENEDEMRAADEACRRRIIWLVGSIAYPVILLLIFSIVMNLTEINNAFFVFAGGIIVYLVFQMIMIVGVGINNCPYCGKYLYRNYGECCQWCGKRIR